MSQQPYLLPVVVFLAIIALAFVPANGVRVQTPLLPQTGGGVASPRIVGTVRFADGSPYQGPVVVSGTAQAVTLETNQSGIFSIVGLPGMYTVTIPLGPRTTTEVQATVNLEALQDTHVTITINTF
ncbi:MAG: hypothetical protein V4674_00750 [Patescibacteria group bacterium]